MPFTASNYGAINNAGDDLALFLKVFGGEVIAAHDRSTQFSDKHTVKRITSGKSAQFPLSGRMASANKYLARGESVTQSVVPFGEETISIDGQLYESTLLTRQDEAFTHFDARQVHSKQLGEALAQYKDTTVAQVGIMAARAANKVSGLPGGGSVVNASAKTDGNELFNSLFAARQTLDEKDVNDQAYAYLLPIQYYMLLQAEKLVNRDLISRPNGGLDTGTVEMIAGLDIVKTNNLPQTNVIGTINNKYDVDATNVASLVMTREAVGTVQLQDIITDISWENAYQAYLTVASMMCGHGVLRPECAVEVVTA